MFMNPLPLLGTKLTALRKRNFPNDTQQDFAVRIGVSKGTYLKMEKGDLKVAMGSYYQAAVRHGIQHRFNELFVAPAVPSNLFEAFDNGKNTGKKP